MKRIFYLIVFCLLLLACSKGDKNKNHSDSLVKNMNSDTLVYQINVEKGLAANQELITYYDVYRLKEFVKQNQSKPSKWLKDMMAKKNTNDNPIIAIVKEKR